MSPLSGISPIQTGAVPAADLMSSATLPVSAPSELAGTSGLAAGQAAGGDSFATMLGNMVSEVNAQQNSATQTVNALQSGQNVTLPQAVIAMEEANVSFQLMVEVRNRLLDSYKEIMSMQI
jgi:flagellar hook-basal body complex protein FliE